MHTHTWAIRWDESGPLLKSGGTENPSGLVSPARRRESAGFQGGLREVVLESWYYTRRVGQRYSRSFAAQFQGIPNWVQLDPPIPQKAAEEVLEAWFYTRHWCRSGPGGLVCTPGRLGQK